MKTILIVICVVAFIISGNIAFVSDNQRTPKNINDSITELNNKRIENVLMKAEMGEKLQDIAETVDSLKNLPEKVKIVYKEKIKIVHDTIYIRDTVEVKRKYLWGLF